MDKKIKIPGTNLNVSVHVEVTKGGAIVRPRKEQPVMECGYHPASHLPERPWLNAVHKDRHPCVARGTLHCHIRHANFHSRLFTTIMAKAFKRIRIK